MNKLLISGALEDMSEVSPTAPPEISTGDVKYTDGPCSLISMCERTKTVKITLFGALSHVNDYRNVITVLHYVLSDWTVHIFIHSPGGTISVACCIIMAMGRCKARVVTHNIGKAASCGSLILAFGNKIHVEPYTITMFHNAGFGKFDSASQMLTQTNHLIRNVGNMFSKMRDRGIITEDEISSIVNRGDELYFTSEEMERRLRAADIWYEGGE